MNKFIENKNTNKYLLLSLLSVGLININGSFNQKEEEKTNEIRQSPFTLSPDSPQSKEPFNANLSSVSGKQLTPFSSDIFFSGDKNSKTPDNKKPVFRKLFEAFQQAAEEAKEEAKFKTPEKINKKYLPDPQQEESKEIIDLTKNPFFKNIVQQLPIDTDNAFFNKLNIKKMQQQQKTQYNLLLQPKNTDKINLNFFEEELNTPKKIKQ